MEENKKTWSEQIKEALAEAEMTNVRLGIAIGELRGGYYYADLIAFLKGTATGNEDMYFGKMKPIYDEYGYEKVNRILLALDEQEQGGKENE